MKLLVVEDDQTIASGLVYSLEKEGYDTRISSSVVDAKQAINQEVFDLFLLDLSLPDGTGYEVFEYLKTKYVAPTIFLTANDDEINVVRSLDMGADDYITKPFRIRELMSRIKSALRHYQKENPNQDEMTVGAITVNTKQAKVYKNNQEIFLTALEYRLLLTFMNNLGQTLTRNQLLGGLWDVDGSFINDNTLSVYIKRLREKLETDTEFPNLIVTVRGIGYRMEDPHAKK